MKLLHTSDWHVGKVLKGLLRLDEQRRVLAEIVSVTAEERVDLVLVAGDMFESASPSPESQALVWSTILDLHQTGAEVVVIAGNHDNGHMLEAIGPLAAAAGIHVLGRVKAPANGGVIDVVTASGERAVVACLPFLSQRYVVHAADLLAQDAARNAAAYADRYRAVVGALCERFGTGTVNVVVAHGFVRGAEPGGGERPAQIIEDYWVDPTVFPPSAQYVALGHLHRTQQLPGPAPIWYCGSPIQVDFGEGGDDKNVLVVEVEPGRPAKVRERKLSSPRRLRTLEGSLAELRKAASEVGDDLLRVIVTEPRRAGLADEVRDILPNALEVRLAGSDEALRPSPPERSGRSPQDLFASYLAEQHVQDSRVEQLFAKLLDEVVEEQP
jgi:DNA repair protein SbcD/Mre11